MVPKSRSSWPVFLGPLKLLCSFPGHLRFQDLSLAWLLPPAVAQPDPMFLVCLQGGDLRAALTSSEPRELGWYGKGRQLCLDILKGLVFLHQHKVRFWAAKITASQHSCVCLAEQSPQCRAAASLTPFAMLLQVVHHDLKVSTGAVDVHAPTLHQGGSLRLSLS